MTGIITWKKEASMKDPTELNEIIAFLSNPDHLPSLKTRKEWINYLKAVKEILEEQI